ncbi:GntR family transcriptional regulator [Kribbella endophytica]
MPVDTNDPRPSYVQIADGVREAIDSGELAVGAKLPSGRELAKQWGVSLMTLQKAIDHLRDEGRVYAQQGRGVFVASPDDQQPADDLSVLRTTVEQLQERLGVVERQLGIVAPQPLTE